VARLNSYNDPQPLEPMITLTAAHVVVGAMTLASVIVLALRCWRSLSPALGRKVVNITFENPSGAIVS